MHPRVGHRPCNGQTVYGKHDDTPPVNTDANIHKAILRPDRFRHRPARFAAFRHIAVGRCGLVANADTARDVRERFRLENAERHHDGHADGLLRREEGRFAVNIVPHAIDAHLIAARRAAVRLGLGQLETDAPGILPDAEGTAENSHWNLK